MGNGNIERSIEENLKFPYISKEYYENYKTLNRFEVKDICSLKNVFKKILYDSEKHYNEELKTSAKNILYDFQYFLNNEKFSKEKITAKAVEHRFALLGDGVLNDNIENKPLPIINDLVQKKDIDKLPYNSHYILKNNQFKKDINYNNYHVSIKSILKENDEVNMGAFYFQNLIEEILPDNLKALVKEKIVKK